MSMEEKKLKDRSEKESGSSLKGGWKAGILSKAPLLVNLCPAVLVVALVAGMIPATQPSLQEVPDLLSIDAQAATRKSETEKADEKQAKGTFKDGVYKGSGTGYGGKITVQVTVKDKSITSVEILSAPGETASFFNRAKGVIDQVIQKQSWEVDVVSGATYSSKGILAAIENALTGKDVKTETAAAKETQALKREAFQEPAAYKDGTYYGSARGFGGNIRVKVTISGGKIAGISIVSASAETPSYFSSAKSVVNRILKAQSPNVDTVSGATYSSTGIINAVKSALSQAAVSGNQADLKAETVKENKNNSNKNNHKKPDVIKPSVSKDGYVDGVYTGTAEGFGGDITVEVTIAKKKIKAIRIVSAEDETPSYLAKAKAVIDRILKAQSPAVDTVSGATYSSTGIINAVTRALDKALPDQKKPTSETEKPTQPATKPSESTAEEEPAKYRDGEYQGTALCSEEDLFTYTVQVTATVTNGKITAVTAEKQDDQSDDPDGNDFYMKNAINGRTRGGVWYEGVIKQILNKQSADQIDVVSSATYSSNAIAEAARGALSQAAIDNGEKEEETKENGEESPKAETQAVAAEVAVDRRYNR